MEFIKYKTNTIHKSAIISPRCKLGKNNYIGPYCTVYENVTIGDNNKFISHVSIGSLAEHIEHERESKNYKVIIGDNNTFREFITINKPTSQDSLTLIEDDCYIMRGGHISHDTWIESKVIMSCNVVTGGHSRIMKGAYMGINSCTHPYLIVGAYCIAGMGSVLTKDFPPGRKIVGVPAKDIGWNTVGLERANLGTHELDNEASRFAEAIARREQ